MEPPLGRVNFLDTSSSPGSPFSGYETIDFNGALVGMFLEDTLPAARAALPDVLCQRQLRTAAFRPTSLRYVPDRPVFLIGDGLTETGTGNVQIFVVPATATHLYLGFIDSCTSSVPGCYSNNAGAVRASLLLDTPALLQGFN